MADLRPLCLLLLPRPLEGFILRDQAEDLLRAEGVVAVDPPRVPYGALGAPAPGRSATSLANGVAKRLIKALRRNGDRPKVIVIFHPVQVLLARAILARDPRLRALVRPLGPLRARLRRRPAPARAPERAARGGGRSCRR